MRACSEAEQPVSDLCLLRRISSLWVLGFSPAEKSYFRGLPRRSALLPGVHSPGHSVVLVDLAGEPLTQQFKAQGTIPEMRDAKC